MEAGMKFCGIDLHSNNSLVTVSDEADRVVVSRRCPNDLKRILAMLDPHRGELVAIAVESTYNWYWLVDGLKAAGYEVKLANTVAMKRYEGLKHRGDEEDAAHLAQLLRLDILPTGYVHPPEERALRDLGRRRVQLVRARTRQILCVENVLAREGRSKISSNDVKRLDNERVAQLGLGVDVELALKANVAVIAALNEQIALLESRLLQQAKPRREYELLNTIPGIGRVLAIVILLESGPMQRFAEVGHFASYARCVDSAHYSNGKKKGEGNRKNGNAYLAWAFIEAANAARRHYAEARRFFDRKKTRTNAIVATKALAHKLARASYHVVSKGEPFDMKRCFA
jgi:transposase